MKSWVMGKQEWGLKELEVKDKVEKYLEQEN